MGIVQGLTEFLPISSSAHLILVPQLLGWNDPFINSLAFDVMLHMGTLVALLDLLPGATWLRAPRGRLAADPRPARSATTRTAGWPGCSSITVDPGGARSGRCFERLLRARRSASSRPGSRVMLVVGAAHPVARRALGRARRAASRRLTLARTPSVIGVGPGARARSRASAGRGSRSRPACSLGLERDAAARFSFLMADARSSPGPASGRRASS